MISISIWLICGIVSAAILIMADRENIKGAGFSFFVMIASVSLVVALCGPISLVIITIALLLKFILDR